MQKRNFLMQNMNMELVESGKYDHNVLLLSRGLFNVIKHNEKTFRATFEFPFYNDNEKEHDSALILITAKIVYNKNYERGFEIEAFKEAETKKGEDLWINFLITLNPKYFPMAYNDLNAEIKEILRHELEHVSQYVASVSGKEELINVYKDPTTFAEYLLLADEIVAFAKGFNTKAKTKRSTIRQEMENYLQTVKDELSSHEYTTVLDTWMNWVRKNLSKSRIE